MLLLLPYPFIHLKQAVMMEMSDGWELGEDDGNVHQPHPSEGWSPANHCLYAGPCFTDVGSHNESTKPVRHDAPF